METSTQIQIPLNKVKLSFMLIGSIVFVGSGIWFVIKRPTSSVFIFSNPIVVFIAGIAAIMFFGLCALFLFRKLNENVPGLIINDQGINDNSSGISIGLILWKDIRAIQKRNIVNQNFITIILENPEEYIARQTSIVKRKIMAMNYKTNGSPISISANGLKCDFDQLYDTLIKELNSRK